MTTVADDANKSMATRNNVHDVQKQQRMENFANENRRQEKLLKFPEYGESYAFPLLKRNFYYERKRNKQRKI